MGGRLNTKEKLEINSNDSGILNFFFFIFFLTEFGTNPNGLNFFPPGRKLKVNQAIIKTNFIPWKSSKEK